MMLKKNNSKIYDQSNIQHQTENIRIVVIFGDRTFTFILTSSLREEFKVEDLHEKCCTHWDIQRTSYKNYRICQKNLVFDKKELLINIYKLLFEGMIEMSFFLIHSSIVSQENFKIDDIYTAVKKDGNHGFNDELVNFIRTTNNNKILQNPAGMDKSLLNNIINKQDSPYDEYYVTEFDAYLNQYFIFEKFEEFVLGNYELEAKLKAEEQKVEEYFTKKWEREEEQRKIELVDEEEDFQKEREKRQLLDLEERKRRDLREYRKNYHKLYRKMPDIRVTLYQLFLFRFKNFLLLVFYITFYIHLLGDSTFENENNDFILDINNVLEGSFLNNKLYERFFLNEDDMSDMTKFKIKSKRDLSLFIGFILNNIIAKNNENIKINAFDVINRYGYNIINSIKVHSKFVQFANPSENQMSINAQMFDEQYPILEDLNLINELTNDFDLQINDLIDAKMFTLSNLKQIFPFLKKNLTNDSDFIYSYNYNDTDPVSAEVYSYTSKGYDFFLILNDISKAAFDRFSQNLIKFYFSELNLKFLTMSINLYHPVINSLIRLDLNIEFLSIGYVSSSYEIHIVTYKNDNNEVLTLMDFRNIYMILFSLNFMFEIIFCVFIEKKLPEDPNLINRTKLKYDAVCIFLYIFYYSQKYLTLRT